MARGPIDFDSFPFPSQRGDKGESLCSDDLNLYRGPRANSITARPGSRLWTLFDQFPFQFATQLEDSIGYFIPEGGETVIVQSVNNDVQQWTVNAFPFKNREPLLRGIPTPPLDLPDQIATPYDSED